MRISPLLMFWYIMHVTCFAQKSARIESDNTFARDFFLSVGCV